MRAAFPPHFPAETPLFLQVPVQGLPADPQLPGGLGDVAGAGGEGLAHGVAGEFLQLAGGSARRGARRGFRVGRGGVPAEDFRQVVGQVGPVDGGFVRVEHGHGGAQQAGVLAQVAGPAVGGQAGQEGRGDGQVAAGGEFVEEAGGQGLEVGSLAQGRQAEGEAVDSVVEVAAEAARRRFLPAGPGGWRRSGRNPRLPPCRRPGASLPAPAAPAAAGFAGLKACRRFHPGRECRRGLRAGGRWRLPCGRR